MSYSILFLLKNLSTMKERKGIPFAREDDDGKKGMPIMNCSKPAAFRISTV